jgi:surface carbohydrate biosynthesis protein (TIGR04326 family)
MNVIIKNSAATDLDNKQIYLWHGYHEKQGIRSISAYAEANGDRLKRKYLKWIYDLGQTKINNKNLINHLKLKDGFSFWWMTLLVEKSVWKSAIYESIRLLALEEMLIEDKPNEVTLVHTDPILDRSIKIICRNLGLRYRWRSTGLTWGKRILSRIKPKIPHLLKGFFFFTRSIYTFQIYKKREQKQWNKDALLVCAPFFNINIKAANSGQFKSSFWGDLIGLLERLDIRTNWLHYIIPNPDIPDKKTTLKFIRNFNAKKTKVDYHSILESYFSFWGALGVFKSWLTLMWISMMLRSIKGAFRVKGTNVYLWYLMKEDWKKSLIGATAIENLFFLDLFDKALQDAPHQKKGLYICENQGWERAMIHCWRKYRHGKLIGFAHSTVRYWDLRYFEDTRSFLSGDQDEVPKPDKYALNGEAALRLFSDMDCPSQLIEKCEALRYNYLFQINQQTEEDKPTTFQTNILVLGDYVKNETDCLLKLLEQVCYTLPDSYSFSFKPHPSCTIQIEDYEVRNLRIVKDPLNNLLKNNAYDIAFASNKTSASLEAYLSGLGIIVLLNKMDLNFSPLRGVYNVTFVTGVNDLINAIEEVKSRDMGQENRKFFYLDHKLLKWKKILL